MHYSQDEKKPGIIPMFEVASSNIKAAGYDRATLTLRIQFKTSPLSYDFKGVSSELYLEFMKDRSKGKFFFSRIKGKFDHEKIDPRDI